MRINDTSNEQSELRRLRELSARVGRNHLLVQASSGNTSVKIDGTLWIKASGKWLIQAETDELFIPVQLARARKCLERQVAIPETEDSSSRVCASIETAMHAILPQKVVVHVHSANTIAWAVREDGPTQIGNRLSGLHWQWIPYVRSGVDLAKSIHNAFSRFPRTDAFILANHGLVVCGESCDEAEQLLAEVETCLAIQPRPAAEPNYAALSERTRGSAWSFADCAAVHALATDPISRRILSGGVLYPCQFVFLPATVRVPESSPLKQLSIFRQQRTPLRVEECGVLCSNDMTRAEQEMLIGLSDVVQRIDSPAAVRYLSFQEVIELLNLGSEHYRSVAEANCASVYDEGTATA
jgi:rhamnose utilization protein RhaD (predicted bifunctional aldolase and dehydrogenase)